MISEDTKIEIAQDIEYIQGKILILRILFTGEDKYQENLNKIIIDIENNLLDLLDKIRQI